MTLTPEQATPLPERVLRLINSCWADGTLPHQRAVKIARLAAECERERYIPDELLRNIQYALQYYGQFSEARMGERTGGVVQGCPRGEPYIDRGQLADKVQSELQKWLAAAPKPGEKEQDNG